MKGKNPTKAEKAYWDRLVNEIGCIACFKDGYVNHNATIHHCDGRTRPGAHKRVLPLCAGHHQQGTGEDKTMIAVHPYKAQFEARYGTQLELMILCDEMLGRTATGEQT